MHTLVNTFVSKSEVITVEGGKALYPILVSLPPRYSRTIYFETLENQEKWLVILKQISQTFNFDDVYDSKEKLGEGSMGSVYECVHKKTGFKFAVKHMKKAKKNEQEVLYQRRELETMKMCQHPNLIRMFDIFETNSYYYIVIELCIGGDFYDYLGDRNFRITESRALELAKQLAGAVFYLHSYNIIHRDLKLENVMMLDRSDIAVPKIVDFGLATILAPEQGAKESVGTVAYAPPEIFKGDSYDKGVDIWSLGTIFFGLIGGYLPYDDEDKSKIMNKVLTEDLDLENVRWKPVTEQAKKMIRGMLEKDKNLRWKIEQVVSCDWIKM